MSQLKNHEPSIRETCEWFSPAHHSLTPGKMNPWSGSFQSHSHRSRSDIHNRLYLQTASGPSEHTQHVNDIHTHTHTIKLNTCLKSLQKMFSPHEHKEKWHASITNIYPHLTLKHLKYVKTKTAACVRQNKCKRWKTWCPHIAFRNIRVLVAPGIIFHVLFDFLF